MKNLTRRGLLTSVIAAPVAVALGRSQPSRERIVTVSHAIVAHRGKNNNGHDYSDLLKEMADAAIGKYVLKEGRVRGVVREAFLRISPATEPGEVGPDALRLWITWFCDPPIGVYITPTGTGCMDKSGAIRHYTLRHFDVNADSAFERATPVALHSYHFRSDAPLPKCLREYRLRASSANVLAQVLEWA